MDEVLERLFSAESNRDWDTLRALLHPQVEWTLVGSTTTVVRGRDAYMRRIEGAYSSAPHAGFTVRRSIRNEAGLIVPELLGDEGNVAVDVFDVRAGLVVREWEFLLGNHVRWPIPVRDSRGNCVNGGGMTRLGRRQWPVGIQQRQHRQRKSRSARNHPR